MRKITVLAMLFVLLAGAVAVGGENPPANKVAKYIWVQTEQFQAGKEAPYMKLGAAFKEALANTEFTWLAAMPIAGNGNEVTYVTFQDNFAAVEKMMAAFMKAGGEMQQKNAALMTEGTSAITHSHSFIAEFQPELSHVSDKITPAETTRWDVTTYRLKPGAVFEFTEFMKEIHGMHRKAGDNDSAFVYRVIAGEPSPAFIVVTPLKTLADLDVPPPAAWTAMMTTVMRQHIANMVKNTVAGWGSVIYVVDPRLSNPPKNFLAENPGFWTVKEPAPVVAKGKKVKKAVEPAAIKEKEKEKK